MTTSSKPEELTQVFTAVSNYYKENVSPFLRSGAADILPIALGETFAVIGAAPDIKVISIENFLDIVNKTIKPDNVPDNSPGFQLPPGTFYFNQSSESIKLMVFYPETRADVTYDTRSSKAKDRYIVVKDVCIPGVITSITLTKAKPGSPSAWTVESVKYLATSLTFSSLPSEFLSSPRLRNSTYYMPFNNFYNHCGMCYGSNSMPYAFNNDLRGLAYYYKVFLTSPYNSDLSPDNRLFSKSGHDPVEYLKDLATRTSFPYTEL